jgi:hypothetical protein
MATWWEENGERRIFKVLRVDELCYKRFSWKPPTRNFLNHSFVLDFLFSVWSSPDTSSLTLLFLSLI